MYFMNKQYARVKELGDNWLRLILLLIGGFQAYCP